MNNYYNTRPPRKGVIVFASLAFIAIFGLAAYSAYVQQTDLAHSVHISPTSAHYGTASMARSQGLAVPMHSTAPLLSGGEIRSYAYSGHATLPKATSAGSGFKIHTVSSATVHTIGSGGGGAGGGGAMSGGSGFSSSSSKGLNYSGGSVSIPTLAVNSSIVATSASAAEASAPLSRNIRQGIGPRKAKPTRDGYDGEEVLDDEDYTTIWTYSEEAEDWFNTTPDGTKRYDSTLGYMVEWNGSEWVKVNDQGNPGVPVGNTPWFLFLLLSLAYAIIKRLSRSKIVSRECIY